MNIQIKSRFKFDEHIHDKAYGMAKSMVFSDRNKSIKKVGKFILTASKTERSVFVRVQRLG